MERKTMNIEKDEMPSTHRLFFIIVCVTLFLFTFFYIFTGCTYSINMVHTEGYADDVVDEDQKASPNVSPTLSIPASAL